MLKHLIALEATLDNRIKSINGTNIEFRRYSSSTENSNALAIHINKTGTYNFYNTSTKIISVPPRAIFLIHEYPTFLQFKGYSTNKNGLIGYWNKGPSNLDLVIHDDANYSISFILEDNETVNCQTLTAFTGNAERSYGRYGIPIGYDRINSNLCVIGASSDIGTFEASISNLESINSAKLYSYGENDTYCDLKDNNNCVLNGTISVLVINPSDTKAAAALQSYGHSSNDNVHGYCLFSKYDYIIMTSTFDDSLFWMILIGFAVVAIIIIIATVIMVFTCFRCRSTAGSEPTPEGAVTAYSYADDYAPQPMSFNPNYDAENVQSTENNINPPAYNNAYNPYGSNNQDGFKSPYENPVKSPYDEESSV